MIKIEDLVEITKTVKSNVKEIIKESQQGITLEEYVESINKSGTGKCLQHCVNAFPKGFNRMTAYEYLVFYYDNFIKEEASEIDLDEERLEGVVIVSYMAYMRSGVELNKEEFIKIITMSICKALELE